MLNDIAAIKDDKVFNMKNAFIRKDLGVDLIKRNLAK